VKQSLPIVGITVKAGCSEACLIREMANPLMVGDRRYDISGAHAVGIRGLGVLWGYGTRDELETTGADQLVASPADLARTVLSMVKGKESPG
jgi:phosphoglycolate phosphatase